MKKISIFTNHFYPEVFGINDIANILSKNNKVEVITQIPNYPIGDYYKGYGIFKNRKEQINENLVAHRLIVIPRKKSKLMLVLNYLSYIVSSLLHSIFKMSQKSDLVLIYITSPIFISWAAIFHANRSKAKKIMYLLDLWPHNFISMLGITNKRVIDFLNRICLKIYKKMDVIYVSSYAFIDLLENLGVDSNRIKYMPQHEYAKEPKLNMVKHDGIKILFAGNIGYAQGLDTLIDVAEKLSFDLVSDIHFNIVGDGRYLDEFKTTVHNRNLDCYFTFTGRVDKKDLDNHYANNTFGLVMLKDDPILNLHLPAKVQSYMANKIPILCIANGESARIVKDSKAGVVIENTNVDHIYNEILKLRNISEETIQNYGENGYKYCVKNFNLDNIIKEMEANFNE